MIEWLRERLGTSVDDSADEEYRCISCGGEFTRPYRECPECGGPYVAPIGDEGRKA